MDLQNIMLSKTNQTQKSPYCTIPLHEVLEWGKLVYGYRNPNSGCLCMGLGRGHWLRGRRKLSGAKENALYLVLSGGHTGVYNCQNH